MEISTAGDTEVVEIASRSSVPRSVALSRPFVITGMILATALSALDGTIVATAMPTIVGVLGGLPLYSLVISAFLLTATTTVPLYGKLSDMYGRKPVFMFGSGVFILGSALCGLAWDMPSLIAFRAVQGMGAGAVVPVSLTIIGDLFEVEERARLQGVFSAVWGVSSIIGPLVGGAIVQYFNWRWVFFINVPVGIVSALLLFLYLREPVIHGRGKVDVAGAVTLTVGVGLLLFALQSGGRDGWLSPSTLGYCAAAFILLAFFILVERRAEAPVLSLGLLSRPIIAVPCVAGALAGAVLIGFAAYVPIIVQGAWGGTPIEAGLIVAPLSLGWPVASGFSGRLVRSFGYRNVAVTGMFILLFGSALLLLVAVPTVSSNLVLKSAVVLLSSLFSGAGLGMSTTPMLIAVQISVPWSARGIATASVQFFRNMGQAVGSALLGMVLTATLAPALSTEPLKALVLQMPSAAIKPGADPALGPVNALFDLAVRDKLAAPVRGALAGVLANSLSWVYLGMLLLAVAGAVAVIRFPKKVVPAEEIDATTPDVLA